ncbi:ATP-dependent helicase C-terminal domain-containing protein [Streptomyces sp. HYC2]|uniref:ATP-dependent helicase C-terminal domain-containing protein n=1 Tax=Streptomyces sp. HYC2 TaxID=2955207 RepID=UPI00247FB7F8|nr:ATP-dependent helicase C-terminal domain-containing protein [Streptomyces sp. HYC2]
MIRHAELGALPVRGALPALHEALDDHGTAVLVAPPGTGKTTLVPLALAGLLGEGPARRVVVAEPRRIAARAAARRMAWLLGEKVGGSVGYTVRGERVVGRHARVEVVTTGVLLQRLQRDQELAGVDVVVLDECHERHLDADTVAAFLWDVREALRPELRLVAASATTDARVWARLLGGAPVVEAHGVSHPVEVVWAPPARPVRPPHGMRVDPALLTHVASVVRRALAECAGDVLCFLPGVGEIGRVAGLLGDLGDVDVLQVHGRAPADVQDAVLVPGRRRRVVLATSVAESSLTVPGVRVVVDSGLAREPRVDHARGLSALTTVRASRASGRQRAGRAGREAPGAVYRCWAEAEEARLPAFPAPEIKVADLTAFALQAACWGDPDASGLALPDPPPGGAMAAAREVLTAVGAVDSAGRATDRGRSLARLGVHPRLGRALLDASAVGGAERAAEVVALLSEELPREYGDDLATALRTARRGGDAYTARWRAEVRRLRAAVSEVSGRSPGTARSRTDRQAETVGPEGRAAEALPGSGRESRPGAAAETGPAGPPPAHSRTDREARAVGPEGKNTEPLPSSGRESRPGAAAETGPAGPPPAHSRTDREARAVGPEGKNTEPLPSSGRESRPGAAAETGPAGPPPAHSRTDREARAVGPEGKNTEPLPSSGRESRPGAAAETGPAGPPPAHSRTDREARAVGPEGKNTEPLPSSGRESRPGAAAETGPAGPPPAHSRTDREARAVGPEGKNADAPAGGGGLGLVGLVAALAFPERVARLDGGSYLMISGTRAELMEGSPLWGAPWIAVAVADRPVGRRHARVQLAAVVDEDVARLAAGALHAEQDEVRWGDGDVVARRVERLGAVELAVRPLADAGTGLVRAALLDGLRQEGFGPLRWSADAEVLRQRLAFLRRRLGEPWPDVSDDALHARVDEWLEPELGRARRRADLARIDAGQALTRLLPWASGDAVRLDELAPERLTVPSGSRVRVDYADPERPVLAVKLQEMFGLDDSPTVAGVPVLVHLLSPAGRPAAVTADLASFWRTGYRDVRAELRGRYPKHPWPEDPASAEPTRHTNARLRR